MSISYDSFQVQKVTSKNFKILLQVMELFQGKESESQLKSSSNSTLHKSIHGF